MNIAIRFVLCMPFLLLVGAFAQDPPNLEVGIKPYGSYHGGDIDSVSITNGNLNLHIPLLSYPQRGGKLDLSWDISYNNKSWAAQSRVIDSHTYYWYQWRGQGVQPILNKQYTKLGYMYTVPQNALVNQGTIVWVESIASPDGATHGLDGPSRAVGITHTMDASGFESNSASPGSIMDSAGNVYVNSTTAGQVFIPATWTDPNGNQINISPSLITDTLGRQISVAGGPDSGWGWISPWGYGSANLYSQNSGQTSAPGSVTATTGCPSGSVSARAWTVPAYNNGSSSTATYTFCYGQYTISSSFGVSWITDESTTNRFINAVLLPNGTEWTFSYDAYGDLAKVTLPTGGYVAYGWAIGTACASGGLYLTFPPDSAHSRV